MQGGIQNELFKASYEEAQALEDEVGILKQEEAQRLVVIRDVETQRNRIARVAADTQRKVKLTEDDVAFKHVIVQDLKRTRKEVVRRYNDFQQLYQLVKNQRNKFVSLVAVAGQGIGEFKEKVKILTNEMEVRISIGNMQCKLFSVAIIVELLLASLACRSLLDLSIGNAELCLRWNIVSHCQP